MNKTQIILNEVAFNGTPRVSIRVINPEDSKELKKDKKKKPFRLLNDVIVTVFLKYPLSARANKDCSATAVSNGYAFYDSTFDETHKASYTAHASFSFKIKDGYIWNGADIPKPLWWVGSSKDNDYLIASMVHDFMLEFKEFIYNDVLKKSIDVKEYRRLTSLIFREILKESDINCIKANIMAWCVDVFQATFNRKAWKIETTMSEGEKAYDTLA